MTNSNLVSKCGIYCGACYIYRAYKDGGRFLSSISEQVKVPAEEIKCEGCSGPAEILWDFCKKCPIASCLKEKGYRFCYECVEFDASCEKYEKRSKFCAERGENIRESLMRIKAGEAEAWLREQDQKWRCASCGKPLSWYEKACHHCGQPAQL